MKKTDEKISLLPFIESDKNGFLLDIPVLNHENPTHQGYSYPFQIVNNAQNLSMIVKGGLKVNHSDPFKSLFLFVQRDHYPLSFDDLISLTNTGVDRIWYETMQSYSVDKKNFLIPGQLTSDGKAVPFRPLFFCKKEKKFFHPPCPECGAELDLCDDDELLIKAALPPYSTSLKRYLFCPECHLSKGRCDFYQFSRSADDPFFIRDRFDLVKDFNKLKTSVASNHFPCLDCPGYAKCYVTEEKAASYIGFFSFYPFYMLFFDAEPIKAVDFIPLLSGDSFDKIDAFSHEIKENRQEDALLLQGGPGFFFENEEKFYLEVLFLKLSFFEQLTRSLSRRIGENLYPTDNISIQSIYIRTGTSGNILPFFYDFKLSIIDLIYSSKKNYIESNLIKNSSLYFMATLWFYIFLVNKNQGQDRVYSETGRLFEQDQKNFLFGDYNELIKTFPSVAMENIFWDPSTMQVPGKWYKFWEPVLLTGLDFFDTKKEQGLKECLSRLIDRIEDMKNEIKKDLFSKDMGAATEVQPAAENLQEAELKENHRTAQYESDQSAFENQAIARILKNLKTRWTVEDDKSTVPDDVSTVLDDEPDVRDDESNVPDDDVLETVVLSSSDMETDPADVLDTDQTIDAMDSNDNIDVNDVIEKTMIISAPQQTPSGNSSFNEMEKTMIISPADNDNALHKPESSIKQKNHDINVNDDNDDFEKTIIINPGK